MEKSLVEFRKDLISEISNDAIINLNDETSQFLSYYTDQMIEAEEILEFEEYDVTVNGSRNRKAKVDGYSYDLFEQTMSLFIADYSDDEEISTLTNTEISRLKNKVLNFLDFSYDNTILEYCEESSQEFQLAAEINNRKDQVLKYRIYIISDSELSRSVKSLDSELYNNKKVDIIIWDIKRLYNLLQSSFQKESITINVLDFSDNGLQCIKAIEDDNYESYLGIIDGTLLANLYLEYGGRLLEGNVRSFLSVRGKINKGIRNTIRTDPEIFFVYNNGIACTATDIQMNDNGEIISLTDFQIINGGQTTASIANAVIQDKASENVSKIKVPMKLTVLKAEDLDSTRHMTKDEIEDYLKLSEEQRKERFISNMTSNIARFANSQNKVDESDFFSNHPYHIRFEELSRKVYAPPKGDSPIQTIWFYERAKGQYTQEQIKLTKSEKKNFELKHPKKQVVKKTDLAKYIMSGYQYPHIVSRGNQNNMRHFAELIDKAWKKDKDRSSFNNYYYKKSIALAILFKEMEKLVSHATWYEKSYRANIVTYSIASLFYMIDKQSANNELNYLKLWNEQGLYPELSNQLDRIGQLVSKIITAEDRPTKNVTEWCKREACWTVMQKYLDKLALNEEFKITLISKNESKDTQRQEKKEQKEDDKINYQVKVVKMGESLWKSALAYGVNNRLLSEKEKSLLKSACDFTRRLPSEKQCPLILQIYDKLVEDGFVPN